MKTTTIRVAKYAGAGLAGIATSCALAAPALAMRPDPAPGGGRDPGTTNSQVAEQSVQGPGITNSQVAEQSVQGPSVRPAPPSRYDDAQATTGATSDGIDWSTLATGLGGGMLLSGAVAVGANELRRRQARPA